MFHTEKAILSISSWHHCTCVLLYHILVRTLQGKILLKRLQEFCTSTWTGGHNFVLFSTIPHTKLIFNGNLSFSFTCRKIRDSSCITFSGLSSGTITWRTYWTTTDHVIQCTTATATTSIVTMYEPLISNFIIFHLGEIFICSSEGITYMRASC